MIVPHSSRTLSRAELQASRENHGSPFPARNGFSLIELLIVVAILTMVTGFVLPALRGPLERSRLRSGAVDVQSAWGKARSFAIREGMPMAFRCELGGQHWRIERKGRTINVDSGSDDSETPSGLRAENDSARNPQGVSSRRPGRLVREGWLPDGVIFSGLDLRDSSYEHGDQSGDQRDDEQLQNPVGLQWSEPLSFRPEGRSQDARLRLAGADGFVVHVKIRGLTSSVSFTAPFRRRPMDDDSRARQ